MSKVKGGKKRGKGKGKAQVLWVLLGIINALCLVAFVLQLSIHIPSFGEWFYLWQFDANDTYNVVNMEREHLMEVTRHMIAYMRGIEPDLQIMTIVGGQPRYFFSPIEIRHMVDVYKLFSAGYTIVAIAGLVFAVTALAFVIAGRRRLKILFKCWRKTAIGVFALALVLVAAIAVNWNRAFVIFHEILFNNDYWILDHRVDLLVNIVPYDFFITLSMVIGGFFVLGLGIIYILGAILLRRTRWRRLFVLIAALVVPLLAFGVFGSVMWVVLFIFLGLIALILLLLALALFPKIRYEGSFKKAARDAPFEYNARVRLLWGLFNKTFSHPENQENAQGKTQEKQETEKGTHVAKKVAADAPDAAGNSLIQELRAMGWETVRAIIGHTLVLLKKLFRIFYPKKIRIKGRYGAAEPHATGTALAAVYAACAMLNIDAQIEGDFENEALEIDAHAAGYLRLWALVVPLARYIFKPEIRPIIFGLPGRKPKNNKEEKENGHRIKQ